MDTSDSLYHPSYSSWSDSYKPPSQYQQVLAVFDEDLPRLQLLINSGESVNVKDEFGNTLLHIAAGQRSSEVFDYLLTLEEVKIDAQNIHGFTPLHIALYESNEDKALKLIDKGADINAVTDIGCTPLDYAMKFRFTCSVAHILIEKGAEIDARNFYGQTPLYVACRDGDGDSVDMLLYYGADVNMPDNEGVLPYAFVLKMCSDYWDEIFFNYTFDQEKIPVHLSILTAAMTTHSPWFIKIVEKTSQVVYDEYHLEHFSYCLPSIGIEFFHVFLHKFEYVVQDMFALRTLPTSLQDYLGNTAIYCCIAKYRGKSCLVNKSKQILQHKWENILTELICYFLSWGVGVTSRDLDAVYTNYGYSELFKIMLHMDFVIDYNDCSTLLYVNSRWHFWTSSVIYDVSLDITGRYFFRPNVYVNYRDFETLRKFFTLHRGCRIVKVPSLLELARNI